MSILTHNRFLAFIIALLFAFILAMAASSLVISSDALLRIPLLQTYLLQAINAICIYVLPPCLVAFLGHSPWRELFLDRSVKGCWIGYVSLWMLVSLPAVGLLSSFSVVSYLPEWMNGVSEWMKAQQIELDALSQQLLNVSTIPALMANLLCIAVIPAVAEELFFRSGLIRLFSNRFSLQASVWFSAIIFSAIHLQFDGFIARMLMGATFGYLLIWSGSVIYPMVAHFVNNAYVVLMAYYSFNVDKTVDSLSQPEITLNSAIMGVFSLLISIGMLVIAKKRALKPSSFSNN